MVMKKERTNELISSQTTYSERILSRRQVVPSDLRNNIMYTTLDDKRTTTMDMQQIRAYLVSE